MSEASFNHNIYLNISLTDTLFMSTKGDMSDYCISQTTGEVVLVSECRIKTMHLLFRFKASTSAYLIVREKKNDLNNF